MASHYAREEELESIPLTPSERRQRQDAKERTPLTSKGGWASSMALFSPPPALRERKTPRRQKTPFHEPSVDRTTRTPVLRVSRPQDPSGDTNILTNPWLTEVARVESLVENPTATSAEASIAEASETSIPTGRPSMVRFAGHEERYTSPAMKSVSSIASSHLFGESIQFDYSPRSGMEVSIQHSLRDPSVDLEEGGASQDQPDARTRISDASTMLKRIGATTSEEIFRFGESARSQLSNMVRSTTSRVFGHQAVYSDDDQSDDLPFLRRVHKEKIRALSSVEDDDEDHHDFVLVLTPQAVYEFWADRLDFRAEHLVESPTEELQPSATDDTEESGVSEEEKVFETIDSRPFLTTPISKAPPKEQKETKTPQPILMMSTPRKTPKSPKQFFSAGLHSIDNNASSRKHRLSLFERAVGVFSPGSRLSFATASRRDLGDGSETPTSQLSTPAPAFPPSRRRWGNRGLSEGGSVEPLPSFGTSIRKRIAPRLSSNSPIPQELPIQEKELSPSGKRRKLIADDDEVDIIPSHLVPRGIAARTNGMMQFLDALKRGIIVRRHRPAASATLVKIFSNDGGDTIKFEIVDTEDAILALKEQRMRYNRNLTRESEVEFQRTISRTWSQHALQRDSTEKNVSLPDFIAARHYRQKQLEKQKGLSKAMVDAACKLKNNGAVRTADIIAVHPARHEDPRSTNGDLGSHSLRRSKSEFHTSHSFTIVTRATRHLNSSKLSCAQATEKWYNGEGSDVQYKLIDFETATEGEYWLVFRGFLLLHRDAASGRFASQRATGFGSHYNQHGANDDEEPDCYNRLQKDIYHEPQNIGRIMKFVAHCRGIDISDLVTGHQEPGAVPPPSDYFLGFRSPGTQIWSRLRQAGLETSRVYALDTRRVMIKLRCPPDRLTDVAEVLRVKLKTKDGSFAPFRENNMGAFSWIHDELEHKASGFNGSELFRSCQRQTVIDFIIRSRLRETGAELGQTTNLGKMIQARVPLHSHKKLSAIYKAWFHYWKYDNWEKRDGRSMSIDSADASRVKAPFQRSASSPARSNSVLADDARSKPPPNIFLRVFMGCFYQPLDSVEQYFGEKVAMYFAWLQHCSYYLIFLSASGLLVTLCQLATGQWDHPIRPFFSMIVMLWSFVVLVDWRKRSNYLAYRWGTMDYKVQETARPQFKGQPVKDPITEEWVVYYPKWKRWLKYLISFPITLAFTVGTLIMILLVHANRDLLLNDYFENGGQSSFHFDWSLKAIGQVAPLKVAIKEENLRDPTFWVIIAGLPSALGLCLPLLNFILMRISVILNDFENYRTESEYRTHLIIKVFSFRFVCYFATLYYYAVLSVDVGTEEAIENGILRVATGVFIYVTVAHWWGVFLQIQFPILMHRCRQRFQQNKLREQLIQVELEESALEEAERNKKSDESFEQRKLTLVNRRLLLEQAQDEIWREVSLPPHDSFPEYIQAVVQFAFVTCFSVVLPITPLVCMLNHLLSMRFDAYKLCRGRRRPLAQQTGGIGIWEHVLHIVTVIAVLTNCALIGFTNSQFSWLKEQVGDLGLFAIVVGWEHIMLLIKYAMQASTPKLPKTVRDEMKRAQHSQTRRRNWSMRAKKDRRSSARNLNQSASKSEGPQLQNSLLKGRAGAILTTIPSEEASETSSNSKPARPSADKPVAQNGIDEDVGTSSQEETTNAPKSPKPRQPEIDGDSTPKDSDSPFRRYLSGQRVSPMNKSFAPGCESSIGDILGKGIEDDTSLATFETSRRSTGKRIDDADEAAARRIRTRLDNLENRLREKQKEEAKSRSINNKNK